MNTVFAIGNGESRKGVDLSALRQYGRIYGCNALYRDFIPDILVVADPVMREEVLATANHDPVEALNGWSSGPSAVAYAVGNLEPMGRVFLLGFDLYGVNGKHNNIYKGTDNYRDADEPATHCGNWVNQLGIVFRENRFITFFRVGRENDPMPAQWQGLDVKFISYDEMWKLLRNEGGCG